MQDHQSHVLPNLSALRDRLSDLESRRRQAKKTVEQLTLQVGALTDRLLLLKEATEAARFLLDALVQQKITPLEDLITDGLQAVFSDQDLSFTATLVKSRNRVGVELGLKDGTIARNPILRSFGGATSSIVSLLLRLVVIQKYKLFPVLFLDESLPAISGEYVRNSLVLLQSMAELRGIDIFLVTQNPGFLDYATIAYQAQKVGAGDGRLQVRRAA